jgi:hypothetical protein
MRDMMLMLQNAMIFNPPGTDVYVMASTLKRFLQRELDSQLNDKLLKSPHLRTRRSLKSSASSTKALSASTGGTSAKD